MFGFFDQGLAYLHEDLNAGMGGPAGQSINAPQYVDKDGYVAEAQTKRSFTQRGASRGPNKSTPMYECFFTLNPVSWQTMAHFTAVP